MPETTVFYAFAIAAVILIGLAKGGFSGLGALGVPLMTIGTGDPVRAAAILLPILIAQDAVGVTAFRKTWDSSVLAVTLPGAILGVLLGYLLAAKVSSDAVMTALGAVTLLFAAYRLAAMRGQTVEAPAKSSAAMGSLFGIAAGFTSQIAHAGGPPFQMWIMPKNLGRDVLVGTTAVFFAILNLIKVPAYFALGQFTWANAMVTVTLLPVAVFASLAGVKLVRRVPMERFYMIMYVLMVVAGAQLLWDGLGLGGHA